MPTPRPPTRTLSVLSGLVLAFAAASVTWFGTGPAGTASAEATRLADSRFVPDEVVLPAAASASGEAPTQGGLPAGSLAITEAATMQWNGHADQTWALPDGRRFVISPWGATWWLVGGRRERTEIELPGFDPRLTPRRLADGRLLVPHPQGGAWLLQLEGPRPQLERIEP